MAALKIPSTSVTNKDKKRRNIRSPGVLSEDDFRELIKNRGMTPQASTNMVNRIFAKEGQGFNESSFSKRYNIEACTFFKLLYKKCGFKLSPIRIIAGNQLNQIVNILSPGNHLRHAKSEMGELLCFAFPEFIPKSNYAICPCYTPDRAGIDDIEKKNEMTAKPMTQWEIVLSEVAREDGSFDWNTLYFPHFVRHLADCMELTILSFPTSITKAILTKKLAYMMFGYILQMHMLWGSANVSGEKGRRTTAKDRRELFGNQPVFSGAQYLLDPTVFGSVAMTEELFRYLKGNKSTHMMKISAMKNSDTIGRYTSQPKWEIGGYCNAFPGRLEEFALRLHDIDPDFWAAFFHGGEPINWASLDNTRNAFIELVMASGGKTRTPATVPIQMIGLLADRPTFDRPAVGGAEDPKYQAERRGFERFFEEGDLSMLLQMIPDEHYVNTYPSCNLTTDIQGLIADLAIHSARMELLSFFFPQLTGTFQEVGHGIDEKHFRLRKMSDIHVVAWPQAGIMTTKQGATTGSVGCNGKTGLHLPMVEIKKFRQSMQRSYSASTQGGMFGTRTDEATAMQKRMFTFEIYEKMGSIMRYERGGLMFIVRVNSDNWTTLHTLDPTKQNRRDLEENERKKQPTRVLVNPKNSIPDERAPIFTMYMMHEVKTVLRSWFLPRYFMNGVIASQILSKRSSGEKDITKPFNAALGKLGTFVADVDQLTDHVLLCYLTHQMNSMINEDIVFDKKSRKYKLNIFKEKALYKVSMQDAVSQRDMHWILPRKFTSKMTAAEVDEKLNQKHVPARISVPSGKLGDAQDGQPSTSLTSEQYKGLSKFVQFFWSDNKKKEKESEKKTEEEAMEDDDQAAQEQKAKDKAWALEQEEKSTIRAKVQSLASGLKGVEAPPLPLTTGGGPPTGSVQAWVDTGRVLMGDDDDAEKIGGNITHVVPPMSYHGSMYGKSGQPEFVPEVEHDIMSVTQEELESETVHGSDSDSASTHSDSSGDSKFSQAPSDVSEFNTDIEKMNPEEGVKRVSWGKNAAEILAFYGALDPKYLSPSCTAGLNDVWKDAGNLNGHIADIVAAEAFFNILGHCKRKNIDFKDVFETQEKFKKRNYVSLISSHLGPQSAAIAGNLWDKGLDMLMDYKVAGALLVICFPDFFNFSKKLVVSTGVSFSLAKNFYSAQLTGKRSMFKYISLMIKVFRDDKYAEIIGKFVASNCLATRHF